MARPRFLRITPSKRINGLLEQEIAGVREESISGMVYSAASQEAAQVQIDNQFVVTERNRFVGQDASRMSNEGPTIVKELCSLAPFCGFAKRAMLKN